MSPQQQQQQHSPSLAQIQIKSEPLDHHAAIASPLSTNSNPSVSPAHLDAINSVIFDIDEQSNQSATGGGQVVSKSSSNYLLSDVNTLANNLKKEVIFEQANQDDDIMMLQQQQQQQQLMQRPDELELELGVDEEEEDDYDSDSDSDEEEEEEDSDEDDDDDTEDDLAGIDLDSKEQSGMVGVRSASFGFGPPVQFGASTNNRAQLNRLEKIFGFVFVFD
jgi:hypothetical protein